MLASVRLQVLVHHGVDRPQRVVMGFDRAGQRATGAGAPRRIALGGGRPRRSIPVPVLLTPSAPGITSRNAGERRHQRREVGGLTRSRRDRGISCCKGASTLASAWGRSPAARGLDSVPCRESILLDGRAAEAVLARLRLQDAERHLHVLEAAQLRPTELVVEHAAPGHAGRQDLRPGLVGTSRRSALDSRVGVAFVGLRVKLVLEWRDSRPSTRRRLSGRVATPSRRIRARVRVKQADARRSRVRSNRLWGMAENRAPVGRHVFGIELGGGPPGCRAFSTPGTLRRTSRRFSPQCGSGQGLEPTVDNGQLRKAEPGPPLPPPVLSSIPCFSWSSVLSRLTLLRCGPRL